MVRSLLAGVVLAVSAALAVWLGDFFGLELEPVALLGVALGAVVALVPDGRPGLRLIGFVGGVVVAWAGYVVRAALLPDTAGGRAVAALLVVLLCTVLVLAALGRIPLWATLVGAASLVGAYETVYAAAPPQVASTSVSTVSALVLTTGVGFLAGAFFGPDTSDVRPRQSRTPRRREPADRLDVMERAQ